jgi:glycerol-3-phosphate cytidylyltransferase-like family protein
LEQAKRYGDRLVAIIATNKSIKKYAGVKPDFSASIRFQQIKELNIVDELIMSTSADYFKAVTHYKPHAVAIKT